MDKLSTITLPNNQTYAFHAETATDLCGELKVDQKFTFRMTGGGALTKPYSAATIRRLLGNTVVFNQLVQNGDFSNGATGWAGVASVVDGVATATKAATGTATCTNISQANMPYINGHKYLFVCLAKSNNATTYFNIVPTGTAADGGATRAILPNWTLVTCMWTRAGASAILSLRGDNTGNPDADIDFSVKYSMCIDLTFMFGAGKEPATVEEFTAIYPLIYYSPTSGMALPFASHALETTGLNQWDEVWELGGYRYADGAKYNVDDRIRSVNPIRVFSSTSYHAKSASYIFYYDVNMTYLGYQGLGNTRVFTTPANCTFIHLVKDGVTSYAKDICVNISAEINGTYEPYQRDVATLGLDSFRAKDGQGNFVAVNGLWSVGSVYDEIDCRRRKYVKRVAKVNLKLLDWHRGGDNVYYAPNVRVGGDGKSTNIISEGPWTPSVSAWSQTYVGQIMTFNGSYLWIHDNRFSGLDAFVAAMEDVALLYELVTPVEYDLVDGIPDVYHMHPLGTEEISPENGPEPYSAPARMDVQYGVTAGDLASAVSDVERKTRPILASREYDYACAASSQAAGYIFFGNVVPTSEDSGDTWYIRYRMYIDLESESSSISSYNKYCHGVYECRVGVSGTSLIFEVFNQMYSTSYRPLYYHLVASYADSTEGGSTVTWQSKYENRATNPVKIGIRIQSAYADTQPRHYRIELLETYNCSFTFSPAFETYGTVYTSAKYGVCSTISGDNGLQETGDTNDITTMQLTYSQVTAGSNGIKRYSIIMQDAYGKWQSLTSTSGTGTSKTVNQNGFRLGSKLYYVNRNTDVAADARLTTSQLRANNANIDLRYSLNINTTSGHVGNLVPYKPLYIVGSINATDGLFYLDTLLWWTQDEPSTEDGKIYIKVCEAIYNDYANDRCYRGDFFGDGQIFWYKNGAFRTYEATALQSVKTINNQSMAGSGNINLCSSNINGGLAIVVVNSESEVGTDANTLYIVRQ